MNCLMAKVPSKPPAPSQSLRSKSERPQKPASDGACLQALTGAGYTSLRAGWPQVPISTCPQSCICHVQLCVGSGLSFLLASNTPDIWISVFCFLGVHPGHQAVRYLGGISPVLCTFSPPPFFKKNWKDCDLFAMESRETLILNKREMPGEKNYFLYRSIATIATKLYSSLE